MNSLSHKEKGREKRKVERQAYARLLDVHLDAQVNSVSKHINALVLSFCEQRQTTRWLIRKQLESRTKLWFVIKEKINRWFD